ncbi:hypothetical protein ACFL2X_03375 [Candidatus Latescibacterota bacterium]
MKKFFMLFVSVLLVATIIVSCSDDDSSTGPDGGYIKATISHWGYDFSEAEIDTTSDWIANKNDGEMIGWPPIGDWRNDGLWFRTRVDPNRTQSYGNVALSTIASVDTVASAWDTAPPKLSMGDVVVAQCLDGFVKFKVLAEVDTSMANYDWAVDVEFLFSETPSFSE